jgi:hypothetical protein
MHVPHVVQTPGVPSGRVQPEPTVAAPEQLGATVPPLEPEEPPPLPDPELDPEPELEPLEPEELELVPEPPLLPDPEPPPASGDAPSCA